MPIDTKNHGILINDDGWLMGEGLPPLTADDLNQRLVSTYANTPVGTLCWCIGGHEVYTYETNIGDRFGAGHTSFENPSHERTTQNLQARSNHVAVR